VPDVRLFVRAIDYVSDQGAPVRAWQPYARVEFIAQNGMLVPCECIVDSGAPLSVLPYSLWRGRNLQYTTLGTQLTLSQTGIAAPEAPAVDGGRL